MSTIIECTNCQGQVKIPDNFPGGEVGCAHCGTMLNVTMPGQPARRPGMQGGAARHRPISPEEFRRQAQRKEGRGCLVKVILILVVVGGGLGYALQKMTFKELIERSKALSEEYGQKISSTFSKIPKSGETSGGRAAGTGVAPSRSYETKGLPGLRGQTGDEGGWKIEEEGKAYFVVAMNVAQRHFIPGDEGYQELAKAAEEKKQDDPSHEVPSRDQCRVFDPKFFKLLIPGGDPLEGTLISIGMGGYQGFYDSFRMVIPKGATEDDDEKQLGKTMDIEVAFVVEESADFSALKIEFQGLEAVAVPAPTP